MDKKILFGGAAALIMGASFLAAPASAAIEITHSGEATLIASFSDTCVTTATTLNADDPGDGTNTPAAFAAFLGLTYTPDDETLPNQIEDALDALTGGTTDLAADASMTGDISFDSTYTCLSGVAAENPVWSTSSKLDWSAAGTLANGLSVSVDQDAAIALSGAFGSVTFKKDGDSAVKASMVNGDGDITRAGAGFGGHATATSGTAGADSMVVTYQAPSMGGMDLFVSYAPNAAGTKYDNAAYTDTIGFGASFNMDAMSISAGYETATANTAGDCDWTADVVDAGADISAKDLINKVYGTDECGDQTLLAIGASMSAGGLSINAGYTDLDTEEADRATTSIGVSTSAGNWNLGLDWVSATKSSRLAGADTTQELIGASISTALGDGVDLSLFLSNNKWDDNSQATSRGGNGATNDFLAEAELKISY
jgi:hypothetical protein